MKPESKPSMYNPEYTDKKPILTKKLKEKLSYYYNSEGKNIFYDPEFQSQNRIKPMTQEK